MSAPAKAVDLAVTAVRLPITIAEQVVGEDAVASIPPVRAVTAVQAWMLDAGGTLLHDERLNARASLLRAALERQAEAADLELVAEERREEATAATEARLDEAEALRQGAAAAADEQRRRIAKATQAKQRATKEAVAKTAAVVERVDKEREKRLAADERAARRSSLVDERQALAQERKAVQAKSRALKLEDDLDKAKSSRRSRSS
jgi:hypothetical protein